MQFLVDSEVLSNGTNPGGGGGGGGGTPIWTGRGCSVVSLRGCKFQILVSLRVFFAKCHYFLAVKVSFRVAHEEITKKNEFWFVIWSLLGVCICFGHAQIGLFQRLNSKFPTSIPVPSIWESPPPPPPPPPLGATKRKTMKLKNIAVAWQEKEGRNFDWI